MSKYVKELVTRDLKRRLEGVEDAVLVNCSGMDANTTNELRGELSGKDIQMMVVKNSLARRATEGTSLHPAFEGTNGQVAVLWGSSDFVSLVKEAVRLDKDDEKFEKFVTTGGVLDGEKLDPDAIKAVSKWPSREEQISMLVGQILGPGATLSAAMLGPGKTLNSQIKSKGEGEE
ncbi:50S ribosomal protein L10 [Rhodopirellula sp. JC740]|uniref:Large ribosomal subunit protein uL10 n=1 Tax=Rhodopirellula halodulae TaxID=2894198 RepID=A0ABS8NF66_9BACT|nr:MULTISPECIES: 50S ribosomal protein L10 [unclassified Rhodopirellula]MCC9642200.1 50S ribosomal protein L10 [Rhodopirellula sp. JC740]MCC9655824.1 50S ribosomal protein L10 [Rhodopirellula sp. JC737]